LPRWRTPIFFSRVRPSPNPPHRCRANNEDKVLRETVLGACEKGRMRGGRTRIMRPGWASPHAAARAVAQPANMCGDMRRALHATPGTHVRPSCPRHERRGPVFTGQAKGPHPYGEDASLTCCPCALQRRNATCRRRSNSSSMAAWTLRRQMASDRPPYTSLACGERTSALKYSSRPAQRCAIRQRPADLDARPRLRLSPHAPSSHPNLTKVCAHGMSPHHR
jgi:hypothetical protein